MAVAEKNVNRTNQIVRQGIKDGASIETITRRIMDACEGVYHACGYDDTDLDVAMLCYRLGGRGLVTAMA